MKIQVEIVPLRPADAPQLAAILQAASPGYVRHFHPFAFDEETVRAQLERAQLDQFWGIRCATELAGFFMLRGFDEGYERPAFGVFIAEPFAGQGLARVALGAATKWCEEHSVQEMMLTVHPANMAARRIYEAAGFAVETTEEKRLIMTKRLRE